MTFLRTGFTFSWGTQIVQDTKGSFVRKILILWDEIVLLKMNFYWYERISRCQTSMNNTELTYFLSFSEKWTLIEDDDPFAYRYTLEKASSKCFRSIFSTGKRFLKTAIRYHVFYFHKLRCFDLKSFWFPSCMLLNLLILQISNFSEMLPLSSQKLPEVKNQIFIRIPRMF